MTEIIRPANTFHDASEITRIKIEGWKNSYKSFLDVENLNNVSIEKEARIRYTQMIKGTVFYVYEEEKCIKGYVWFEEDKKNNKFELCSLYVNVTDKFRGIGKKLFDFAKEEGRKKGYKKMYLWTFKDNNSGRRFFEQNQGKIIDKQNNYIEDKLVEEVCYEFDI